MDDVTASIIIACQTAGAVNSISKLGFALGMLGRKAIEFGSESIKIFSDLQEETQKFETVFAGVQNKANKHVQELINNFGQSELSARRMMAQTGDLLRGVGFDKRILTYLSSAVSKYGSDLTSFSNYAGGAEQATFALTKTMLGEQEMAKSLGVFIKYDSKMFKDLEKQALSTGLAIGENGEILRARNENEARALASFYEIVRQKSYVLGDYWRNQGSIANQSRKLENQIDELKTTIGGFLDSVIHVGDIKGQFADTFTSITDYIKKNSDKWSYYVSSFINIIRGGFELIGSIVKTVFNNVYEIGKYTWEILSKAWGDAPGFFGAIWGDIKNIVDNTWNLISISVTSEFEFYGDVLKSFLKNWRGIFNDIWEITKRTVKSIGVFFVEAIKSIGKIAWELGKNFWDLITGEKSFSEAAGSVFNTYKDTLTDIGDAIDEQWRDFELGSSTKQFSKDIADAYMKSQAKKMEAAAKLISETGQNTSKYLDKSGIQLGDLYSITDEINGVIDNYNRRARIIEERRGTSPQYFDNAGMPPYNGSSIKSMQGIADGISRFRSSSQAAVLANSVEAIRLQSRRISKSPEMKIQEQQLDVLNKIRVGIEKISGPQRTSALIARG